MAYCPMCGNEIELVPNEARGMQFGYCPCSGGKAVLAVPLSTVEEKPKRRAAVTRPMQPEPEPEEAEEPEEE